MGLKTKLKARYQSYLQPPALKSVLLCSPKQVGSSMGFHQLLVTLNSGGCSLPCALTHSTPLRFSLLLALKGKQHSSGERAELQACQCQEPSDGEQSAVCWNHCTINSAIFSYVMLPDGFHLPANGLSSSTTAALQPADTAPAFALEVS